MADKSLPIDMGLATCVLLPDDQILVVGYSSVHVYDILSDSREMKLTFPSTAYSNLIDLYGRVFYIEALGQQMGEFCNQNISLAPITAKLSFARGIFSSVSVPADLFANFPGSCEGIA